MAERGSDRAVEVCASTESAPTALQVPLCPTKLAHPGLTLLGVYRAVYGPG
jgi:hypothetical protein